MQQFWLDSKDLKNKTINYGHPLSLKKKKYRKKKKKRKVVEERGSSMEAPFDYLSTHKHFDQDNLDKSKRKVEVDLSWKRREK